jgi:hypothetical protein
VFLGYQCESFEVLQLLQDGILVEVFAKEEARLSRPQG